MTSLRHHWNDGWNLGESSPNGPAFQLSASVGAQPITGRCVALLRHSQISESLLVGGLEHCLFFHILGIISPTDEHIFQRGRHTTKQIIIQPELVPNHDQHLWASQGGLEFRFIHQSARESLGKLNSSLEVWCFPNFQSTKQAVYCDGELMVWISLWKDLLMKGTITMATFSCFPTAQIDTSSLATVKIWLVFFCRSSKKT